MFESVDTVIVVQAAALLYVVTVDVISGGVHGTRRL
jgi:hypothetical protein